ncbi:hypothetical protein TNCV_3335651 [Trichonephila clavipes]|nr:hypothetical protein TNCV_3335651 [Trichonephila clavipes]
MTEANDGCGDCVQGRNRRATVEQLSRQGRAKVYQKCLPNYYSANIAASGPAEADAWFIGPIYADYCSSESDEGYRICTPECSGWTSTEWRQVAFSDEDRVLARTHRTDGR